jgi:glycine/D-amino acid oxidase-like deaminating enzyme
VRVVVIGAGIVGAAVAAGLTRRGARVTVLEERFPGAGTTGASFGRVNANHTDSDAYFTLTHAAVHAHHALGSDAFRPTGHLEWATGESRLAELNRRVDRLRGRDYAVERITAERATELEPGLAPRPEGTEYVLFPEEAHVFPARLLGRLLAEARAGGAEVETGVGVREVRSGAVGASVVLADGGVRTTDVVVSCAGHWTGLLLDVPMLDPWVPGADTNGFLATTTSLPTPLSRVLSTDRLNIRPDGGGRLLLRAPDLDTFADPALPAAHRIGAELVARLPEVLTGTEGAHVDRVQVAQHAAPARGRTMAGFVDDAENVYAVVTRDGVTLAPLLADLVAGEVYGTESALLGPFRPGGDVLAFPPAGSAFGSL